MALKEKVEEPVVRIIWPESGEIKQKPRITVRMAQDAHLYTELVILDAHLLHAIVGKSLKFLGPIARTVIPENEAMPTNDLTETVVNAFHPSSSLVARQGLCRI